MELGPWLREKMVAHKLIFSPLNRGALFPSISLLMPSFTAESYRLVYVSFNHISTSNIGAVYLRTPTMNILRPSPDKPYSHVDLVCISVCNFHPKYFLKSLYLNKFQWGLFSALHYPFKKLLRELI